VFLLLLKFFCLNLALLFNSSLTLLGKKFSLNHRTMEVVHWAHELLDLLFDILVAFFTSVNELAWVSQLFARWILRIKLLY
jgi:hypothetical protein